MTMTQQTTITGASNNIVAPEVSAPPFLSSLSLSLAEGAEELLSFLLLLLLLLSSLLLMLLRLAEYAAPVGIFTEVGASAVVGGPWVYHRLLLLLFVVFVVVVIVIVVVVVIVTVIVIVIVMKIPCVGSCACLDFGTCGRVCGTCGRVFRYGQRFQ